MTVESERCLRHYAAYGVTSFFQVPADVDLVFTDHEGRSAHDEYYLDCFKLFLKKFNTALKRGPCKPPFIRWTRPPTHGLIDVPLEPDEVVLTKGQSIIDAAEAYVCRQFQAVLSCVPADKVL